MTSSKKVKSIFPNLGKPQASSPTFEDNIKKSVRTMNRGVSLLSQNKYSCLAQDDKELKKYGVPTLVGIKTWTKHLNLLHTTSMKVNSLSEINGC